MGKLYLCDMEKEFIPYEQALELKELGFDEPCLASWNFYTRELNYNGQPSIFSSEDVIQLPTISQAFRWFREKYGIDVVIGAAYDKGKTFYLRIETGPTSGYQYFDSKFKTYEEAELACLIKMIEIKKKYI
jgi:hypothetical protein